LRLRRIGCECGRPSRRRRLPCRVTPLHHAAQYGRSAFVAAPTGPSRATSGNAALRRTAEPKTAAAARAQAHAEASRGKPPPPPPPPRPNTADVDGCAVGARRSSGQGGPHSTRTVTDALAARLVVHYCTRGLKCRARRARAAALIGSAKCARARSAVARTARGDRRAAHASARATQRSASSPFRPLSLRIGFGVAGRAATSGDGRGAPTRRARRSAQWCQCSYHDTSIFGQVLIVWTRALVFFRSNPI